ncbi:MAG TPA: hypothetical protein VNM14_10850 [Planctomycetota bacterium]|jgi:hypothetical protein|nr:hypothetical protein [Planctomycetota bacterium]
MSRRLTTLVLAAFYLLQATWLLHAGLDLLLPSVRQAAAAVTDSCCSNACGCPEEVKAQHGCCCVKHAAAQVPQSKRPPVSAIEEARCKGLEDAMTQAFTQPVVCAFAAIGLPILDSCRHSIPELQPFFIPDGTSLEKVPIAQA